MNLGLEVLGPREDGYHELRTLFQTIDLHDDIVLRPRARRRDDPLRPPRGAPWTGRTWPCAPRGSCSASPACAQGVEIAITKRIPVAGGLGGGSSNAAAVLMGLDRLWRLGLGPRRAAPLARRLGADVPFFLMGGTALGLGRGTLAVEVVAAVLVDEVPLVERDHQRPAGLADHLDDPLVLLGDRLRWRRDQHGHLGPLDRGRGAQAGVVLVARRLLDPPADAGGVDEPPGPAAELDQLVDRVDGGAGDVVDDDPLLAGQLVEQRRLADVRLADDGDPARAADLASKLRRRLRQRGEDGVEQVAGPAAVQRRDGVRLPQAQVPQRRRPRPRRAGRRPCWRPAPPACERRRILTTASSASVMPTVASTTNSTASARPTAISACAAIRSARPRASGSQPPVSTTVKARPFQFAS